MKEHRIYRGFNPDENGTEKALIDGEWKQGMWLKGYYYSANDTTYCVKEDYDGHPNNTHHYIVFDRMTDWGLPNQHLRGEVIEETVGQCIGISAKVGNSERLVYENDIVKHDDMLFIIKYGKCGGVANSESFGYMGFYLDPITEIAKQATKYGLRNDILYFKDNLEIVGDIHRNPELCEEVTQ